MSRRTALWILIAVLALPVLAVIGYVALIVVYYAGGGH
jgi:hypothetical protein